MNEASFQKAVQATRIIMLPKVKIATFWTTKFRYYIISSVSSDSSILRIGNIHCSKPTIVTPDTLLNTFEGFSDQDIEFAEALSGQEIAKIRILGYQFKNELEKEKILSTPHKILIQNIKKKEEKSLHEIAILSAPDDVWSLSITKVAMEAIFKSFPDNMRDLEERGYFLSDSERSKKEIEILFSEAQQTKSRESINELGETLQKYGLFDQYEDRFFTLVNSIGEIS